MDNYIIYAYPPKEVAVEIEATVKYLKDKYPSILRKELDEPHITLAYGPPVDPAHTITKDEVETIYPGLLNIDLTHIHVFPRGASYFANPDGFVVIKLGLVSPELTVIRNHLRDTVPLLDKRASEFEKRDGYEYRDPNYIWAHCTLGMLQDVPLTEVEAIVADADDYLKKHLYKIESFKALRVKMFNVDKIAIITDDTQIVLV